MRSCRRKLELRHNQKLKDEASLAGRSDKWKVSNSARRSLEYAVPCWENSFFAFCHCQVFLSDPYEVQNLGTVSLSRFKRIPNFLSRVWCRQRKTAQIGHCPRQNEKAATRIVFNYLWMLCDSVTRNSTSNWNFFLLFHPLFNTT